MGEVEFGTCEICGEEKHLKRKYFHYDFKCECHLPNHFEFVRHCNECTPKAPEVTKVYAIPID